MAKKASAEIVKKFPIDNDEYRRLEAEYGDLCHFQAWQLVRKNVHNQPGDDVDDIIQDLKFTMVQAGSYVKRQRFIHACFVSLEEAELDKASRRLLKELRRLWEDRRRHGARRQKFGDHQEGLLQGLVDHFVPEQKRPSRTQPLVIDEELANYLKSCTWNTQRSAGRKITRERAIRVGTVALADYEYLAQVAG